MSAENNQKQFKDVEYRNNLKNQKSAKFLYK